MQISTKSCTEIKALRHFAHSLRNATKVWREKYASDSRCDKKNFAFKFGSPRNSLSAFSASVYLESYAGYYGNSSVSRAMSFDQSLADRYFASALNQHKQAIFDSMAALAEADAEKLVGSAREEIDALQKMLAELTAGPAISETA